SSPSPARTHRPRRRCTGPHTPTAPLASSSSWPCSAPMCRGPCRSDPPASPACCATCPASAGSAGRSEEHTSELQSRENLVCRLLLEKKKKQNMHKHDITQQSICSHR